MELVQIYSKMFNEITIITNFLAFFLLLLFNFSDPCESGSTAVKLTVWERCKVGQFYGRISPRRR